MRIPKKYTAFFYYNPMALSRPQQQIPGMTAIDAVDDSSTGIAMCRIAVVIQEPRMTDVGTKRTFQPVQFYVCFRGQSRRCEGA
jgi:hypothetical protein